MATTRPWDWQARERAAALQRQGQQTGRRTGNTAQQQGHRAGPAINVRQPARLAVRTIDADTPLAAPQAMTVSAQQRKLQLLRDHELALRLAAGLDDEHPAEAARPKPNSGRPTSGAQQPATAARPAARQTTVGGDCVICLDATAPNESFLIPCGHRMCSGCIKTTFERAIGDISLYPPKCCPSHNIPLTKVRHFLPAALVRRFEQQSAKWDAFNRRDAERDAENPIYCHVPTCSTLIPPQNVRGESATCQNCRKQTCALCKQAEHKGFGCPKSEADRLLESLAGTNGWKNCPGCGVVIELEAGCNHMKCRCGCEFCYNCGGRFGNCDCPAWREDKIVDGRPGGIPRPEQQNVNDHGAWDNVNDRPDNGDVFWLGGFGDDPRAGNIFVGGMPDFVEYGGRPGPPGRGHGNHHTIWNNHAGVLGPEFMGGLMTGPRGHRIQQHGHAVWDQARFDQRMAARMGRGRAERDPARLGAAAAANRRRRAREEFFDD